MFSRREAVAGLDLGDVRVGETCGLGEFLAVQDLYRALGTHHRDLGGRPREVHVGTQVLRPHAIQLDTVRMRVTMLKAGSHNQ